MNIEILKFKQQGKAITNDNVQKNNNLYKRKKLQSCLVVLLDTASIPEDVLH